MEHRAQLRVSVVQTIWLSFSLLCLKLMGEGRVYFGTIFIFMVADSLEKILFYFFPIEWELVG